jgi:hypothetical protein
MILTYNKGAAFAMPIFTKLTKIEEHYMQFSYTELRPNRAVNAESMSRNTVMLLRKLECGFLELSPASFFPPNRTNSVEKFGKFSFSRLSKVQI